MLSEISGLGREALDLSLFFKRDYQSFILSQSLKKINMVYKNKSVVE